MPNNSIVNNNCVSPLNSPAPMFFGAPPCFGKSRGVRGVRFETMKKIGEIAKMALKCIAKIILFPLRYFGGKTWSLPGLILRFPCVTIRHLFFKNLSNTYMEDLFGKGYQRFGQHTLSPDEAKPYLKYVCAVAAVHSCQPEWIEPFGYKTISPNTVVKKSIDFLGDLEAHKFCFFDPKTGLKISLFEKENQVIVAFGALSSGASEIEGVAKQKKMERTLLASGIVNITGGTSFLYEEADRFFTQLKTLPSLKDKKITVSGQCLGGSIASFLSLKHQVTGVCVNSLPLGAGLQRQIGVKKLMCADKYLTHISAKGDYMSHLPTSVGVVDAVANFIGLKTPGNFGRKFLIPTAYKKASDTHYFILGSMMVHMGFDCRTKPADITRQPGGGVGILDA